MAIFGSSFVTVPAMTVGATEAVAVVYVILKRGRRFLKRSRQRGMTIDAGVLGGESGQCRDGQKSPTPESAFHRQYPNAEKVAR